tara:strand:- start:98 stop:367 length:270 start_codon:yes stop_codon:yes gene_type:complete
MTVLFVKGLSNFKSMVELSLLTLLNLVGTNFCEYRDLGHDNYKSLLLAYSDASHEFGSLEVKRVIEKSDNFKVAAIAVAAVKCPKYIME